ncbi:MAG: hypothetical protein IPK24_10925 [Kineosporiaceae bacterium]|nr:hypothetical protein [Kineosporiaceae bacterium]
MPTTVKAGAPAPAARSTPSSTAGERARAQSVATSSIAEATSTERWRIPPGWRHQGRAIIRATAPKVGSTTSTLRAV